MSVTAVVCAGWTERKANVERIVKDLLRGSVRPDHIFVLDNTEDPSHPFAHLAGGPVSVLSGRNHQCRGKFVAALFQPADFYLLADDDTSVGEHTLACLLRHGRPGFVTGYWGVQLRDGSFTNGALIFPALVAQPTKVDAFHGRVMFMAHDALIRMLEVEGPLRTGGDMTGDDILAGLANPGSVVVPMSPAERFVDLEECGVAMCRRPEYFTERDEFTKRALEVLTAG